MKQKLEKREGQNNLRRLTLTKNLVDFASNDYLGLAKSNELSQCILREWQKESNRLGSTGSRLLTGNSHYAEELERRISSFHGYEDGLLFNCGYMANMGLLSTVADKEDLIFYDTHCHASIIEGIKLSEASAYPFRHNNLNHLEERIKRKKGKKCFVCIQSIYSTDGTQAPLKEMIDLAEHYGALVIVDEAHATGIFGPQGKGLIAETKLADKVFAHVVTFGKALGVHGAIVLGSHLLKKFLVNFSRSFIYTTALPFYNLVAIKCSYDMFPFLNEEREKIYHLISHTGSSTQIVTIQMLNAYEAKLMSKQMAEAGFDVRALTSPTVRRGHEVLRICLHTYNTIDELKRIF